MIWITSDLHLGHERLIEYSSRPETFTALLADSLLHYVQKNDMLLCCGDLYIGKAGEAVMLRILRELRDRNVITILVRGNHDRKSIRAYLTEGWTTACDAYGLKMFGKSMLFTHEPLAQVEPYDFNIHGHLHNTGHRGDLIADGKHILISMEHLDYRPIPLQKLLEIGRAPAYRKGKFVAL